MQIPASTYRLQLSPAFTFDDLRKILDYLEQLQISTIYSAPLFQSREGSMHGYDIIDPFTLNKAIGDLESFKEISRLLKEKKMNWLQDIVPNHMAFHPDNPWIYHILEHGPRSEYYHFFDINWKNRAWGGKVMAPILGDTLEKILSGREIKLMLNHRGFFLKYYEHEYPVSAESYAFILSRPEFSAGFWREQFQALWTRTDHWQDLKSSFIQATEEEEGLNKKVNSAIEAFSASADLMQRLLELQYFKPVYWKESSRKINFRRFFTINDLICLRMEEEEVFDAYHTFILQLCRQELVSGLRIDHIDGLSNPLGYLEKLREKVGPDLYLVIEKILEWDEELPPDWPIQGTSGYDFLAIVNNLFSAIQSRERFKAGYMQINPSPNYEQLVFDKKSFILHERMGGELQNLWDLLIDLNLWPEKEDYKNEDGIRALSAFLSAFPVYRIYPSGFPLSDPQQAVIEEAHQIAVTKAPELKNQLDYLRDLLSGNAGKDPHRMHYFLQRCQQFTGPLAAKGVEDTLFYNYNQLISHNEVGDSPKVFGIQIKEFHHLMKERKARFPLSLNATATHDTKRGEDARMRINVLSEIPEEWFKKVGEWQQLNQSLKKSEYIPDRNEEYFIYQSLIGAMAFEKEEEADFLERTHTYLQKALREAKIHTFWSEPDEAYEQKVADFVTNILKNKIFRADFDPFRAKISFYGAIYSLGQTLIKITAPGIPDIYQGTELWDLSYVDPDNRRPVDYFHRQNYLKELKSFPQKVNDEQLNSLKEQYATGKIKMFTLYRALRERKLNPELFEQGAYVAIEVSPEFSNRVVSYARHHQGQWYLIVIPVGLTDLTLPETFPLGNDIWKDGFLELPEGTPEEWLNVYTGGSISSNGKMALSTLFNSFPVALLKSKRAEK